MKIVYVFVSRQIDKYWGMLNISLKSARMHMPLVGIELVTDHDTVKLIQNNDSGFEKRFQVLLTEVSISEQYSLVEKSRYLKTNLRNIVKGDFIFVDCDTVFCQDISNIELVKSVSMVLDNHSKLSDFEDKGQMIGENLKKRGLSINNEQRYFNSGVMLVKDDQIAKQLFDEWFKCWDESRKSGLAQDQYSLNAVNSKLHIIEELDGEWNCQVNSRPCGIKYLHKAIIVHYYNLTVGGNYELNDEQLLLNYANDNRIKKILQSPKTAFNKFYLFASDSLEIKIMSTNQYKAMIMLYKKSRKMFGFIEKFLSVFHKMKHRE